MPELTDREKARDLGNQSAALARSIADVLNDTLDALEAAEKERDRWRAVACNVKDGTAAAEAEVQRLREALVLWQTVAPHHRGECLFLTVGADGCTCGLQAARDATRAALAAPSATGGDS